MIIKKQLLCIQLFNLIKKRYKKYKENYKKEKKNKEENFDKKK